VAEVELATELHAVFTCGDDYASAAKPLIDWNNEAARGTSLTTEPKTLRLPACPRGEQDSVPSSPRPPPDFLAGKESSGTPRTVTNPKISWWARRLTTTRGNGLRRQCLWDRGVPRELEDEGVEM